MITTAEKISEITAKKDSTVDARCGNCGKKLFVVSKNTAKTGEILVEIKCHRCRTINKFAIK